jgi:hypothetical protein
LTAAIPVKIYRQSGRFFNISKKIQFLKTSFYTKAHAEKINF